MKATIESNELFQRQLLGAEGRGQGEPVQFKLDAGARIAARQIVAEVLPLVLKAPLHKFEETLDFVLAKQGLGSCAHLEFH